MAVIPAGQTADAVPVPADVAASVSVISEPETRRAIGDPDDLSDITRADHEWAPAHPEPAAVNAVDNDDPRYATSSATDTLVRGRSNLVWRLKQTAQRNLPEPPAVCPNPTCGHTTTDTSERGRLLEDIQVVWLEPADDRWPVGVGL
ncbi:hypothetical protein NLM24_24035 [Nocardia zapadnayensis]|uniref:hypothetical protein n=1 Tax=Nocardia rhamnosiphila TaxID=426716 RepID=UPI002246B60E|nr:hypothetical protein [Nocardia zapadnayensis]MCX0273707.1 hypothetical protein [Nocardia zapadnayensis]